MKSGKQSLLHLRMEEVVDMGKKGFEEALRLRVGSYFLGPLLKKRGNEERDKRCMRWCELERVSGFVDFYWESCE
jgi:hypothetical protein